MSRANQPDCAKRQPRVAGPGVPPSPKASAGRTDGHTPTALCPLKALAKGMEAHGPDRTRGEGLINTKRENKDADKDGVFEFSGYQFNAAANAVDFHYAVSLHPREKRRYTERVILPPPAAAVKLPAGLLEALLFNTHLMLGISYYKLYCPPRIKVASGRLTSRQAAFWNTVYQKGLGEFYYRHRLDPSSWPGFPAAAGAVPPPPPFELSRTKEKVLLGVGGGKDSIVAGELLKESGFDTTAFTVQTDRGSPVVSSVISQMNVRALTVKRRLDPQLLENDKEAYHGHIPISGIYAWLGLLAAALNGFTRVVVGNEYSSNFGNLEYKGMEINHQWSKTAEFEGMLQEYLRSLVTPNITYFSVLRPFYAIRVARIFSAYPRYWPLFSSCNSNFTVKAGPAGKALWCGRCAKCVFGFTVLSAFIPRRQLTGIFGKNLYEDSQLLPLFKDILGLGSAKPFDCVGTFEEARVALSLARKNFGASLIVKTLLPNIKNAPTSAKKVFQTYPAPTVPPPFRWLGMKKALILGYGREGKATKRYLQKKYPGLPTDTADQKTDANYLDRQKDFDIAVRTPGISKSKIVIQSTTATNIFLSQVRQPVIGITGTKGKSTTASLVNNMLRAGGRQSQLLGNIGRPMLAALLRPDKKTDFFVLELSSYQLDDARLSPHIAVVTNLWPDHMDYHGRVESYYQAKKNIVRWQKGTDYFVYNPGSGRLRKWAEASRAKAIPFAVDLPAGLPKSSLVVRHNLENIKAAVAVARLLRVPDKAIVQAVKDFQPLPHRLERAGTARGITFYDDAASTTPESTVQAIKALSGTGRKIGTIFLGGQDRGYDFSRLEAILRRHGIKNVVLFPDSGASMLGSQSGLNILKTDSMDEAVQFALQHTRPGEACLLSTASPSYSLWQNFEEQGSCFKKAIKNKARKS